MKYAFIEQQSRFHTVSRLCKVLGVFEQGYYYWLKAPLSRRDERKKLLNQRVRIEFDSNKSRYGSPRIYRELRAKGCSYGQRQVAKAMKEQSLRARGARKYKATTNSRHNHPIALNLLNRAFRVEKPNQKWVGDITYLWTREGWLYLAVFLDLYSRRVVGWSLGNRLDARLVCSAFARAIARRSPPPGLLVHSDQGVQYASNEFRETIARHKAIQSMSRKGNCWDNAVVESFFHSFKIEAAYGLDFATRKEAEFEVFDYIERFYNRRRRHSYLEFLSPEEFENTNLRAVA